MRNLRQWFSLGVLILGMMLNLVWLTGCAPSGPGALLKGERLIREGKFDLAIAQLKVATDLLPQNAQAWNHLGLAYHGARQPEKAAAAYRQAIQVDRNLAAARYNLGCLLLEQNDPAGAVSELMTFCLLSNRSSEGWLKLASSQMAIHQWPQAGQSYSNVLQLQATNAEAWNGLGVVFQQRSNLRDASNCFARAVMVQPAYAPAVLNQAVLYHKFFHKPAQALQRYRDYVNLPGSEANRAYVADLIAQLDREINPPNPVMTNLFSQPPGTRVQVPATNLPVVATASNLTVAARQPAGIVASNSVIPPIIKPIQPSLTNLLVSAKAEDGVQPSPKAEAKNAEGDKKPMVKDGTVKSNRSAAGGEMPGTIGKNGGQKSAVAKTVEPKVPSETVSSTHAKADDQKPTTLVKPVRSADAGQRRGVDVSPSASSAKTAAKEVPPSATSRSAKQASATLAPKLGMPRYTYRHPALPNAGNRSLGLRHLKRGFEEDEAGRWETGIKHYREAIQADPSLFEARYNLGLDYFQARQWTSSLLEFETALAIQPDSFNARYNFAMALDKAGFAQDAVIELNKAANLNPSAPKVQLMLGNIYSQKLGQPALARRHYLKFLELDPQSNQTQAIRYWLLANP
jgi:tetratricopeptide (TPR) repeat protein